jgi:chromate reductase, NAD(P)H dehydrogenase (quinone)
MITIVVGTNRPESNSKKVAAVVEKLYVDQGTPVRLLDLADLPLELFAPSSYAVKPAAFQKMADDVVASSGLVIVTPEYNGSMPGVLKYFIDMLKFPESFERKPVCFIGLAAGMWGALRSVEQLQQIFGYRNAYLYPERVFLPGIQKLLAVDGKFLDAGIVERLTTQARGFTDFVSKLKAV